MSLERVLIFGAAGQLGRRLRELLPGATAWDARDCELTDRAAVAAALRRQAPAVIINCAAFTDVDGCERDPARAFQVNALGVEPLGRYSRATGCRVVHYSTDYLFDGAAREPYPEEAPPRPLNSYGASKWLGERWLADSPALIIRTSLLLSDAAHGFPARVLAWAAARDEIRVAADLVAAPTGARDLARMTVQLLERGVTGTINVTNRGSCSRVELAAAVLRAAGREVRVRAATQAEFGCPARRPAYSVLALERLTGLGLVPRPWPELVVELNDEITTARRAACGGVR